VKLRSDSQGRRLVQLLKRKACTYREMLQASESCSPWRRCAEVLAEHEVIVKGERLVNGRKLVTWRVVAATRWRA
jgi:hypothetical protein